ncbi:oligogalacturonate lyase family protein [Paenibacillus sp. HB172176]|uniref:oligogalacturonate lyase family protein n=1 Tax=Paenibacillus sp. HB172176 TaxID=2493690 RepID=UPI0014394006|nr:oligogalacturonate lyase family protein [Paenibacillus sp. HB172176]
MFVKRKRVDSATGRSFGSIGIPGKHVSHFYFTANSWSADSSGLVLNVMESRDSFGGNLYRFDSNSGESKLLLENHEWGNGTVGSDDRYYYYEGHRIQSIGIHDREIQVLYEDEDESVRFGGPMSITNDAGTLGFAVKRDGVSYASLLEVRTGKLQEVAAPRFPEPHPIMTHPMVNPADRNLIFYCHEGRTDQIPDRIWVANTEEGTKTNLFGQRRLLGEEGSQLGEWVGHEMWSYDGKKLFFVKYAGSPLGPTGVYAIDADGAGVTFINGDYPYWHVAVSPDGRYAVADTQEFPTMPRIVLIDLRSGRSEWLCHAPCWKKHPSHPHPSFSPDSKSIVFSRMNEDGELEAALIDL